MNALCRSRIMEMIDVIVARGFVGYFVDEPTRCASASCPACQAAYDAWYGTSQEQPMLPSSRLSASGVSSTTCRASQPTARALHRAWRR